MKEEMAQADEDWITQKLLILGGGGAWIVLTMEFIILTWEEQ